MAWSRALGNTLGCFRWLGSASSLGPFLGGLSTCVAFAQSFWHITHTHRWSAEEDHNLLAAQSPGLTLTSLLMRLGHPSANPCGLMELQGPDWLQLTFSPVFTEYLPAVRPCLRFSDYRDLLLIHPHKLTFQSRKSTHRLFSNNPLSDLIHTKIVYRTVRDRSLSADKLAESRGLDSSRTVDA